MKKINVKKVGTVTAIIVAIILLALGAFLIAKSIKDNSTDDKTLEKYENRVVNYYMNLSAGLNTEYSGLEALYASDETTLENINNRQMINAAINYLNREGKLTSVDYATLEMLYKESYPKIVTSTIYSAENIRAAIKELFGLENFANPTIEADETYTTSFIYLYEEDLYLVCQEQIESFNDTNKKMDYSVIETTSKNNKIITTISIAYCYIENDKISYASDRFGNNIVTTIEYEDSEFPKDKIDEFDKYEFTLSKTKDGKNYVFESVKKVK